MEKSYPYINSRFYKNLLLDEVGSYSTSSEEIANIITKIVRKYVNYDSVITDATAGVGGNTISFAKSFSRVNAVELNYQSYNYLNKNIIAHKQESKIYTHNLNYIYNYYKFYQDVIFIDPPWGGRLYKQEKNLKLYLSDFCLVKFCNKLKGKSKNIILKVPVNFDFKYFYRIIKYRKIYIYSLRKMFIIVIIQSFDKIKYNN